MKNPILALSTFVRAIHCIVNWPAAVELQIRNRQGGMRAVHFHNGLNTCCRPGTEDWDAINEILLSNGYVRAFRYLRALEGSPQIFDFGANIGIFSLRAASEHPRARIYAYEPAPPTADMFKMNHLANPSLRDRIRLHEYGVGGTSRRARFFYDAAKPQSARICYEHSNSFEVEIKNFSEIVASIDGPISLVKNDVEGAEFEIVRQTPPEVWQRIDAISIELHYSKDSAIASDRLLETSRSYGYSVVQEEFDPSTFFLCRFQAKKPFTQAPIARMEAN